MSSASSGSGRLSYEDLEALVAELAAQNAELVAQNRALTAPVEELEREVSRSSRNSSSPPSSDPPKTRAERRREAREKLKRMSKEQRKAGGQPGHASIVQQGRDWCVCSKRVTGAAGPRWWRSAAVERRARGACCGFCGV